MRRSFGSNNKKSGKEGGKTPMDAALRHLSIKPRTVRETERYLDAQQYGEVEVQQVVERLMELDYLNDAAYAEEFVRSRLAAKPVSRRKLYEQLLAHELSKDVIEGALSALPDEGERENAQAVAKKFARQFETLPQGEREARLMRRLLSRGFDFDDARAAVRLVEEEMEKDAQVYMTGAEDGGDA